MKNARVVIVLGSLSDLPAFDDARNLLKEFGVPHTVKILSAHRSPKLLLREIEKLPKSVRVLIAGAGGAAHLAGVVAAHTLLPVIGVPMDSLLKGVDSFVSTSQMPAGVPVATMAIGKAGATNAAILAAEILALSEASVRRRLFRHRKGLVRKILEANVKLRATG